MQAIAYNEEHTSLVERDLDNETILHFSLSGALPDGYTLALNTTLGTLSCIASGDELPRLVQQQQFTNSELTMLVPLLESFPHYCPYEVLFASFYNGNVTDPMVARCRRQLQESLEDGTWELQMRPIRNVLSRTRLKLRPFGVNILSILETGCILQVRSIVKVAEESKLST